MTSKSTPDAATSGPEGKPWTLRPGSAVAIGVICGGVVALLLVMSLVSSPRHWPSIAGYTFAVVAIYLFVIRPCVRLDREGITIVNPLRVVRLTWPVIEDIKTKWALELFAGGKRYSAWGVPGNPNRPRYGRGIFQQGLNRADKGDVRELPKRAKVEAQTVAAEIEELITADKRRKDGKTPRIAEQYVDPVALGLLLGSTVFLVLGLTVL